MKKKTKWQLTLIITVLVLTLYNILPTLLFYTKPLNAPIDAAGSQKVITSMMSRVNSLQEEAVCPVFVQPANLSPTRTVDIRSKSTCLL